MSGPAEQHRDLPHLPLHGLMARARAVRDERHGRRVTFSAEGVHPADDAVPRRCGYCTFAQPPARLESPYLTSRAGARHRPRRRRRPAATRRSSRSASGPRTATRSPAPGSASTATARTVDYLAAMAQLVLDEIGLLPHANAGALTRADLATLRAVAPTQGMMIESLRGDLDCHRGSPDKTPARRLATLEAAGELPDPLHHRHPRRHRRRRRRSHRGPRGHRRLPPPPWPRAGGDRPELPAQAGHRDARAPHRAPRTTTSRRSPWPG